MGKYLKSIIPKIYVALLLFHFTLCDNEVTIEISIDREQKALQNKRREEITLFLWVTEAKGLPDNKR